MPMTTLRKGNPRSRRSSAICFLEVITFPQTEKCTIKISEVCLELYTDYKDLASEQKVEDVLDTAGLFYNKTETWIDSEKLYEILYSFDMEGM